MKRLVFFALAAGLLATVEARAADNPVVVVDTSLGTFKVEFVAFTASGKTYEDTRTFHTCVSGHHKKSKKK